MSAREANWFSALANFLERPRYTTWTQVELSVLTMGDRN